MPLGTVFVLAILAGAFISLRAMFATVATTGAAEILPYGVTKLLAGLVFSLGLILVVVANMYFIPLGLFIKTSLAADVATYGDLTWHNFFVANLLPVTIGNIVGGALMVGVVYWFVYLRGQVADTT